jgi:thioredoxin-like negative regulator of GroEL
MRFRQCLSLAALAATVIAASAHTAAAQGARVAGVVKDEGGQAIRGATVRAENSNAAPSTYTSSTDEKGRFSVLGLRGGQWAFTAEAPGYTSQMVTIGVRTLGPNPTMTFTLKKIVEIPPSGVLGGLRAKDLQSELADADELYNAQQWDQAIAAYRAILAKAPAISVISLQIASAYRNKKDYDNALVAYNDLLKVDPSNDKAKAGISMTNIERGDLKAAEDGLQKAVAAPGAGPEVMYALGDIKRAKGESDEAAKYYQRAADLDPTWGKPWFKLGLIAVDRGDKDAAAKLMEKVITVDPMSVEAIQAKTVIAQLKK